MKTFINILSFQQVTNSKFYAKLLMLARCQSDNVSRKLMSLTLSSRSFKFWGLGVLCKL